MVPITRSGPVFSHCISDSPSCDHGDYGSGAEAEWQQAAMRSSGRRAVALSVSHDPAATPAFGRLEGLEEA